MMRALLRMSLAIVVVLLVAVPRAAFAQAPTWVGVYQCDGTNPDGTTYRGVLEIRPQGAAYIVRWTLPEIGHVYGVGLEQSGVLAISYNGGGPPGLIVFVREGETIRGTWTMSGLDGQVLTETLTPMKDAAPVPVAPVGTRL